MNKLLLFFVLVVASTSVFAFDVQVNQSLTVIVAPDQFGIAGPDNVFTWYNSSELVTHFFNVTYHAQIQDYNSTNLTSYFSDMSNILASKISDSCKNATINVNLPESINTTIAKSISASQEDLQNTIVGKVNDNTRAMCNLEEYKSFLNNAVQGIQMNKTMFDNLQTQYAGCSNEKTLCIAQSNSINEKYTTEHKDSNTKSYIIYGLLAVILFMLFMDYGGGGLDVLRKSTWKRTNKGALPNSKYETPPALPDLDFGDKK